MTLSEKPDFRNAIGMDFRLIRPGEFLMGNNESDSDMAQKFAKWESYPRSYFADEEPGHKVLITKPYFLGMYEVTVGQFRQFVTETTYVTDAEKNPEGGYGFGAEKKRGGWSTEYTWRNPGFPQTDEHPVVDVSWRDASAFCRWLSQRDGKPYKLPTEAQWEYACRAGTATYFSFGDDVEQLTKVGNVPDQTVSAALPFLKAAVSSNDGYLFTSPVGQFEPNPWGLYDMHGNVFEWTDEAFAMYRHSEISDPHMQHGDDAWRVFRGGCWLFPPPFCRSAARLWSSPSDGTCYVGFRVVMLSPGEGANPTEPKRVAEPKARLSTSQK